MEPPMFSDSDLIAGGGAIALALALVWKVRRATKARAPTRARRRDATGGAGDAGTPADHGHGAVWATFGGLGALLSGGDGDGDDGGGDGGGD